jgi:glycosyltransferase involved in cell wall biosynthesis
LVVNEAMNAGLPVIATDAVGAAAGGLVVDGETGVIVPEKNADRLARAFDELAADEPKRRRMGKQAGEHVRAWHYGAAADAFEDALAAALGRVPKRCGAVT